MALYMIWNILFESVENFLTIWITGIIKLLKWDHRNNKTFITLTVTLITMQTRIGKQ